MKIQMSQIVLKDDQTITLNPGSVLVLVGPNNSGKSFFLDSIRAQLYGSRVGVADEGAGLIKQVVLNDNVPPTQEEVFGFLDSRFTVSDFGAYEFPSSETSEFMTFPTVNSSHSHVFSNPSFPFSLLTPFIIQMDEPIGRIQEADLKRYVGAGNVSEQSLVIRLRDGSSEKGENLAEKLASYFTQIFGDPLSFYELHGAVGFHLATVLDSASKIGEAVSFETREYMKGTRKLWEQGLGMRSVAGLLLRIFAVDKPILLIDEPEAFLHPPQAVALGSLLSQLAKESGKQIIIATHDRNILAGISRENSTGEMLQILKLSHTANNNFTASLVEKSALGTVRKESLIRYTPLFDSLFSQATVLVENEVDAYFYSKALQYWFETNENEQPRVRSDQILFISTSGKGNLAKTARLVSDLNCTVLIAADLDNIADQADLKKLVEALPNRDHCELLTQHSTFIDSLTEVVKKECQEDRLSTPLGPNKFKEKIASQLRRKFKNRSENIGKYPNIDCMLNEILEKLDEIGICLVAEGELEDFDRTLGGKDQWIERALKQETYKSEPVQNYISRLVRAVDLKVGDPGC